MNFKAASLGLAHTHYSDPTGLSAENVSTAKDLGKLVQAAAEYPLIRDFTTTPSHFVEVGSTGQTLGFNNSNALVKNSAWDIQLQKTGYIREAGKCVVMLVNIASKPFVIVLLDSLGKYTRIADAQRVKHWLETGESLVIAEPKSRMSKTGKRVHGSFEPRIVKTSTHKR
jgi:D-alanyl-D-alanine endopeptidase (penicillin-binding protein 7)